MPQVHAEPPARVHAALNYLVPTATKPVTYQRAPGRAQQERTNEFAPHVFGIEDARAIRDQFSLDVQGFALYRSPTVVSNFYDDQQVRSIYYPESEALIKSITGASRVVIFDHTVRADSQSKRDAAGVRAPARTVHNDYTEKSGPQRVRDLLPESESEQLLQERFAVINVWRPIVGPVLTAPIALADAASVAPEDFVSTDLVYADRVGEIYYAHHNPSHRWYYCSAMQPDEALLIKCYDSARDGRSRFTAHSAFDDPTSGPDAPFRESIEARTLAFFGPA